MPKRQYVWPLDTFPMDPTPFIFFSLARKVHTWPRRPRLAGKAIVCEISEASGGNSVFLIFQKYVIPDHFSYQKNTWWGDKHAKFISLPGCQDFAVCDARSGARWFLSMCGACNDTCGVWWCLWGAQVRSKCVNCWVCLPRKANRDSQKLNSQSQPNPRQTHQCFLFSHHAKFIKGPTLPFTLSWHKVTYQNHP